MSEAKKTGLKWPVCTVLILALLGGMIYWGYTAFQAEQAITQARVVPLAPKAPGAAPGANAPPVAYRSLPPYFVEGFALVMAAIMGAIIYFWWSLKDLEGGKRYGEEEAEEPAPDSDKVSTP